MGQRNIQFNPHINDLQADQGHTHLHSEPCIVYTNSPNYPPQNINFRQIPERHENNNPLFYAMSPYNVVQHPQHNIDLNVAPPSGHHYNNPYLTPPAGIQVNINGPHTISYADGVGGPFKRKNAEGTSSGYPYQNAPVGSSSSSVAPPMDTRPTEPDISQTDPTAFFMPPHERVVESGSLRSVRNRAGMVGSDSVQARNANVIRGNHVSPPIQLLGNHQWLDMNYGGNSGDMGTLAWAQSPPNLPYVHPNLTGACVEAGGNIAVQGYQVAAAINRGGVGFLHQTPQHHPTLSSMQGGVRGYHLSHQLATSSRGIPMIRYSNNPFQDVLDTGPAFIAPVPPTGFQMYQAHHRGEIVFGPNARHHLGFPTHLRVLPEHEVAMLEIPGYHLARESMDQHRDMRLDIDHMSYEELLALGEQIGSVGSGLSEEFIQNNLKIKTFTPGPTCINLEVAPCPDQETINFCVVCQMDYEHEESVGVLECGHEYHKDCIKKWLVVKNSCPVCKSTALRWKGKDLAIDGR